MKFLNEDGVALTEYVIILGLLVLVVIGAVTLFGEALRDFYMNIVNQI
jgi:Flp pilus assembly pilin Flp